ncbi:hypothetical protein KI387_036921, partial [Taxus chinensis]
TVQRAASSLPITGIKDTPTKVSKHELGYTAGLASSATASIGKFDKKLPGGKVPKHPGKHRKFRRVAEGSGIGNQEKQQSDKILQKVLSSHDHNILDINKFCFTERHMFKLYAISSLSALAVTVFNVKKERDAHKVRKDGGHSKAHHRNQHQSKRKSIKGQQKERG